MSMNVNVGNSMGNMANKFFRKVQGVVFDLQAGKIALKNADGSVTVLEKGEDGFTLKNAEFNVTMSVPAFALHTEVSKVKEGDLVCSDKGILGFILEVGNREGLTNAAYTVLRPNGTIASTVIPTNTIMNMEGIMVVKSLDMGGEGGIDPMMLMLMSGGLGGNGAGAIDPMMFMLMSQGKDSKIDPMMLMAMSGGLGGNGDAGGINPLMFMLMSKGDSKIDPMMMLAMSGGLGGNTLGGNAGVAPQTWNTGR